MLTVGIKKRSRPMLWIHIVDWWKFLRESCLGAEVELLLSKKQFTVFLLKDSYTKALGKGITVENTLLLPCFSDNRMDFGWSEE